jgi:hypothetical protein
VQKHRDGKTGIIAGETLFTLSTTGNTGALVVNAFDLDTSLVPIWQQLDDVFQYWKVRMLKFTYEPKVGTQFSGRVLMQWNPDVADSPPSTAADIANASYATMGSIHAPVTLTVMPKKPWLYTGAPGTDALLYTCGSLFVGTVDVSVLANLSSTPNTYNFDTTPGVIRVYWEANFRTLVVPPSAPLVQPKKVYLCEGGKPRAIPYKSDLRMADTGSQGEEKPSAFSAWEDPETDDPILKLQTEIEKLKLERKGRV